ncbi:MAG: hypothetical protein JWN81_2355 [Solirubrobacterales bacterium]|nr:hypothetical protein [Solirubrobacterales bacterium]
MRLTAGLRNVGVAGLALAALSLTAASPAWAETATTLCEPEGPSKPVLSPNGKGECPTKSTLKYKIVQLPGTGELATLNKILPYVNYVESGIAGKPTIQFSAVNLQVVNGEAKTASINGEGNLVIGYDENASKHEQTGSHDLILGDEQTFTSYGGILAGEINAVTAPFASVTGGKANTASGEGSSASGGQHNVASGFDSSVSGGQLNEAGFISSVSGGALNRATTGGTSWVGGGRQNTATGAFASIFGGKELKAEKEYEAIP